MMRCVFALTLTCGLCLAQVEDTTPAWSTFGTREIDKLPRSTYAEPLWGEPSWYYGSSPLPEGPVVAVHAKPSFRAGPNGLERLCVVEAAVPDSHRQNGTLRFTAGPDIWQHKATWLAPKTRYRALWVPVGSGDIAAELLVGGRLMARTGFAVTEGAPAGLFDVRVLREPVYVDNGYGLMPADHLLARAGQSVRVRFACLPAGPGMAKVSATLKDGQGAVVGALQGVINLDRTTVTSNTLATSDLRPGDYSLKLEARLPAGDTIVERRRLTVVEPTLDPGFGARYADLRYTNPVYVSREATASWDSLWQDSGLRDVVITFADSDRRFVFWRGTSYVPCWAYNSSWLTYEWLEAEPDYHGAVGCVEPIMDKGCKYSRARIVSSTPARVVVHWSYALTDFEQKIIQDERADEYYVFYPDGVGVRKLIGWIKSGWHENQEFIALNRPGNAPHKSLDPQAVTLMTVDGRSERMMWPRPFADIDGWPHVISTVNIPGRPSPFMVVNDGQVDLKVWSDPYVDKPGLFNTYIHWPVSRGIRTTWLDDASDWHRPTHSNLVNIVSQEEERTEGCSIWYWLIGAANREADIRGFSACWLSPGIVQAQGASFTEYDQSQRAYILQATDRADSITVTVKPDGAEIVNPAFVITGAGHWLRTAQCEGARRVEMGRESDGDDLVVWVEGRFDFGLTLTIH